jgi:hypothetical protein
MISAKAEFERNLAFAHYSKKDLILEIVAILHPVIAVFY